MKRTKFQRIATVLMLSALILLTATQIKAQATQQLRTTDSVAGSVETQAASSGERRTLVRDCETELAAANQRINKLLDDLEATERSLASNKAEVDTLRLLVANKDARINGLLELIKEYALLDTQAQKKSFWAKVRHKLAEFIDAATDPRTLTTIVAIIALMKD